MLSSTYQDIIYELLLLAVTLDGCCLVDDDNWVKRDPRYHWRLGTEMEGVERVEWRRLVCIV